jgi:hypothetical protein
MVEMNGKSRAAGSPFGGVKAIGPGARRRRLGHGGIPGGQGDFRLVRPPRKAERVPAKPEPVYSDQNWSSQMLTFMNPSVSIA